MTFNWHVDFGQIIMAMSFIGGFAIFIWRVRGWFDEWKSEAKQEGEKIQENMRQRHRQNTQRMDFLLNLMNAERELHGLPKLTCPYRLIVDP